MLPTTTPPTSAAAQPPKKVMKRHFFAKGVCSCGMFSSSFHESTEFGLFFFGGGSVGAALAKAPALGAPRTGWVAASDAGGWVAGGWVAGGEAERAGSTGGAARVSCFAAGVSGGGAVMGS